MRASSSPRQPQIFHFKSPIGSGKERKVLHVFPGSVTQPVGWKAGNDLRRSFENCSKSTVPENEEVAHLEKEVYFALRYLQDVVEKNTVELLAGSTTVVVENIFVLDSTLQNCNMDQMTDGSAMKAELKEIHRYLAVLVHWSDQVLLRLDRSDPSVPMRRHAHVVPAIHALRKHVYKVVELYRKNVGNVRDMPLRKLGMSASTESLVRRDSVRGVSRNAAFGVDHVDGAEVMPPMLRPALGVMNSFKQRQNSIHSASSASLHSRSPSPQLIPDSQPDKTATDSGISLDSPHMDRTVPAAEPRFFGKQLLHSQSTVSKDKWPKDSFSVSLQSLQDHAGLSVYEVKGTKYPFIQQSFYPSQNGSAPDKSLLRRQASPKPEGLVFSPPFKPILPAARKDNFSAKFAAYRNSFNAPERKDEKNLYECVPYDRDRENAPPPLPPKKQRNTRSYVETFGPDTYAEVEQRTTVVRDVPDRGSPSLPQFSYPDLHQATTFAKSRTPSPMPKRTLSCPDDHTGSQISISDRSSPSYLKLSGIPLIQTPPVSGRTRSGSLTYTLNSHGKSELKGGTVDALISEATDATKRDFGFQEAFVTTYRTFIFSEELISRLLHRYETFSSSSDAREKSSSRNTFVLLLRVVDELCLNELFQSKIIHTLLNFVQQLIVSGDIAIARGLRRKILDKHDLLQKSRSSSLLLMGTPRKSRRIGFLTDFKSQDIAEQMTLLDAELFARIESYELLSWTKHQSEDSEPNLTCFTEHFNKVSFWARTRILEQVDQRDREKYFTKFIKIMKNLRRMQNFNSYLAILAAVDSAPIRRLDCAKAHIEILKELSQLIDSSQSFRAYRAAVADIAPPCIPYIGIALQDLTFVNENADWLDDEKTVVNFGKRWQQYHILDHVKYFQKKCQYPFVRNENIVQFFNSFDNFLSEEHLWQISEAIRPRGTNKG